MERHHPETDPPLEDCQESCEEPALVGGRLRLPQNIERNRRRLHDPLHKIAVAAVAASKEPGLNNHHQNHTLKNYPGENPKTGMLPKQQICGYGAGLSAYPPKYQA